MTKKSQIGLALNVVGTLIAVIALMIYGQTLYRTNSVYVLLAIVVVIGIATAVTAAARKLSHVLDVSPVVNSALIALAVVCSANVMVNQIAYVISGLDSYDTISSYIVYVGLGIVGMLVNIVSSFLGLAEKA